MRYAVRTFLLVVGLLVAGCSTPGMVYFHRPEKMPAGPAPPLSSW